MKRWARSNGLSLFFLVLFLATLAGQSQASWRAYRDEQLAHGAHAGTYADYLVSPDFSAKVMENWQSEFLQFTLYVVATIWLVQRGSAESKQLGREGLESDADQRVGGHADARSPLWARVGGWRTTIYSNSLLIVMTAVFFGAWFAQSISGLAQYNQTQGEHREAAVSWVTYLHEPAFWDATLQNWQSEFLAVGTMAIFSVYLRQRGSPESKPVGAPHEETVSSE
jgi:uncharacterized protein DUF6766